MDVQSNDRLAAVPRRPAAHIRPRSAGSLPPPETEPRGADVTREKLLQATHELLFERSGEEPSVAEICERADVRVAMVSYCFGGKAQLLEALIDRAMSQMMREQQQLIDLGLPPEEALVRQVRASVYAFVRFPYMTGLSERLATGDRMVSRLSETFVTPTIAWYRQLVDAGVADGVFRPVDPTFLLFSIVGMCEFAFSAKSWFEDTGGVLDEVLVEQFADHTVALLLDGMTVRAG